MGICVVARLRAVAVGDREVPARDAVSARRARTARLGRCEAAVPCGRVGLKGAAGRRAQATKALQGASTASD